MTTISVFSDDFEGGDLTNWTSNGSNWSNQTTTYYAGSYAARGNAGSSNNKLSKTLSNILGIIYFDFYILTSATNQYCELVTVMTDIPDGYGITAFMLSNGHFQFIGYDGESYTNINLPTDTTYTNNTWYHIVVTMNFIESEISFSVDGNNKGTANLYDANGTLATEDNVVNEVIFTTALSTAVTYIDNVSVSREPTNYSISVGNLTLTDSFSNIDLLTNKNILIENNNVSCVVENAEYIVSRKLSIDSLNTINTFSDFITLIDRNCLLENCPISIIFQNINSIENRKILLVENSIVNIFQNINVIANHKLAINQYNTAVSFADFSGLVGHVIDLNSWLDNYANRIYLSLYNNETEYHNIDIVLHSGSGSNSAGHIYLNNLSGNWPYDIRFTKSNGTTPIEFCRVDSNENSGTWKLKISSDSGIYLYFGKSDSTDSSSGKKTYLLYDNFENTLDNDQWFCIGANTYIQNSIYYDGTKSMELHNSTNDPAIATINYYTNDKIIIDFYTRISNVSENPTPLFTYYYNNGGYNIPIWLENGHIKHTDINNNKINLPIDTTYLADVWYHIIITLDFNLSTINWNIDNVDKGTSDLVDCIKHIIIGSSNTLREIILQASSTPGAPNIFIDNIRMYKELSSYWLDTEITHENLSYNTLGEFIDFNYSDINVLCDRINNVDYVEIDTNYENISLFKNNKILIIYQEIDTIFNNFDLLANRKLSFDVDNISINYNDIYYLLNRYLNISSIINDISFDDMNLLTDRNINISSINTHLALIDISIYISYICHLNNINISTILNSIKLYNHYDIYRNIQLGKSSSLVSYSPHIYASNSKKIIKV